MPDSRFVEKRFSQTETARDIRVHRSTMSRQLRRNSGTTGYYYYRAQSKAENRQLTRYAALGASMGGSQPLPASAASAAIRLLRLVYM